MTTTKTYLISHQQMEEEFLRIKEKILAYVPSLFLKDTFFSFLSFLTKWQHYSIYNIILIHMQYPAASYLAGFHRWKELSLLCGNNPDHTIIKHAFRQRGITLLMPFSSNHIERRPEARFLGYKPIFVFDISQTNHIPIPKGFSPFVSINEMDFSLFLKILRSGNERFVRFVPYETKEAYDLLRGYPMIQNTIFFDTHIKQRKESLFISYVRYVTQTECKVFSFSQTEQLFIFQAALKCLFEFYELEDPDLTGRLQLEQFLKELSDKSNQDLLDILHVILQTVKVCIFRIKLGFKVQLATGNDSKVGTDLWTLEQKIRKELEL